MTNSPLDQGSPASEVSILDSSEQACEPSGNAKLTSGASASSKSTGPESSVTETSEPSPPTQQSLPMFSALDSPASQSASPEKVLPKRTNAGFGPSVPELLASYDRDGSCWRTFQASLDGECPTFSETWPRSGMTRNGIAYELPTSVRRTSESESGLLPTPAANPAGWANLTPVDKDGKPPTHANQRWYDSETGRVLQKDLQHVVERGMWPTPRASDGDKNVRTAEGAAREIERKGGAQDLASAVMWPTPTANRRSGLQSHGKNAILGRLNPRWVEWLMGFPVGWLKSEDSGTPSSPKSPNGSGSRS